MAVVDDSADNWNWRNKRWDEEGVGGGTHQVPMLVHYVYLYLPECREILWFSDGSAAAAGYGGGGYGEISTFVTYEI